MILAPLRQPSVLVGVLLASLACAPPEAPRRTPSVLLVTLDTTRADRLGCYGNARIDTPNLDRLAASGTLFRNAFTPVPSTLPSHASIHTGWHPARHGIHDNGIYRLDDTAVTLAEVLGRAGYRTGAFVSAFVLDADFGLAQGFETYGDRMEEALLQRDPASLESRDLDETSRRWLERQTRPYQRRADSVTREALAWLDADDGRPFFLWVHYFDPHMSYRPPPPWDRRYTTDDEAEMDGEMATFLRLARAHGWRTAGDLPAAERDRMVALYDGEIAFVDSELGHLFASLDERGIWDETLILAVGDHGEGFGEHGQFWEHNGQIFDEVLRVPLLLKRSRESAMGSVFEPLTSTLDVAPTLLRELGLGAWQEMDGVPLPYAASSDRRLLLEALRGRQAMPMPYSWLGMRSASDKLVLHLAGETEVLRSGAYDLGSDPGELAPRDAAEDPTKAAWQEEIFARYRRLAARGLRDPSSRDLDADTREALEALGYLGKP